MESEQTPVDPGHRVMIVEHDPDLAQLLQDLLREEGFQTEWVGESAEVVARIQSLRPDVLMINLPPRRQIEANQLLDDLRADPVASRIPVVTMTTSAPVSDAARASYNVRESLIKPLDLEDLLAKIKDSIGLPPMQAAVAPGEMPTGVLAQAEQVVAEHSREALFEWVRRLSWEAPWRSRADMNFSAVLDSAPVLLEGLNAALRHGNAADFFEHNPDAVERAREHARTRRRQDISLTSLIREYTILRDELWAVLGRHLPQSLRTVDFLTIERTINGTLDRIIELTVPAYIGEPAPGAE